MDQKKLVGVLFVMMMVAVMPRTALAHHVGDKTIPGQDFQVADGWLDPRAHKNAPWNSEITGQTFNNQRKLTLSTYNELSEDLDMRNDNSSLHERGEQFDHSDLWPAFTGRYPVTYNGQK